MAFHEVRFPTNISFGSTGGPERRTEIVTLANGFEERNTPWADSRRRYDAGIGLRGLDDLEELLMFFEARSGQLHGFRWKDWTDFRSAAPSAPISALDQPIGQGDGTQQVFSLVKEYRSGAQVYRRPIRKPVAERVVVAVNGEPLLPGSGFEVDGTNGTVSLSVAPDPGTTITAGFEFDVPVRFDTDRILVSLATFEAGELPRVPVVEIRV
jgi:uncharacterized protein (TIGR02217 family)